MPPSPCLFAPQNAVAMIDFAAPHGHLAFL
jgi:hypothetical protein